MLDRFAPEVFLLILEQLPEKADVNSVSQVSKLLHQRAVPELYRSITFFAIDEKNLTELGVSSFLAESAQYLKYVKDLRFAARFHKRLSKRCEAHYEFKFDETDARPNDRRLPQYGLHDRFLDGLTLQLMPLLSLIGEGNLHSFSWDLGTCVPQAILTHISAKQPNIKSLSIVTDITCYLGHAMNPYNGFHLSQLRQVSWVADGDIEMQALGEVLTRNAPFLEEIELDCESAESYSAFEPEPKNQLAYKNLKLIPGAKSIMFKSLRKLTLSRIYMVDGIVDLIPAFNVSQLHSLKLQDCLGINKLLDMLVEVPMTGHLISFELNFAKGFAEHDRTWDHVARFLRSFEGLRDLYVKCPEPRESQEILLEAVLHHRSTLERVVYGESKTPNSDLKSILRNVDPSCLGVCSEPTNELIQELELLYLSQLSIMSCFTSESLKLSGHRPSISILHIRVPGCSSHTLQSVKFSEDALLEVYEFASWAFGTTGLSELKILAYGDLSYQDRLPYILLCRSQESGASHRELTKEDAALWEMMRKNRDFLEACPDDRLMRMY